MNAPITTRNSKRDYRRLELLSGLSRTPAGNPAPPGRIMALASISHELPEALVAESLTQKLVHESGRRVLWLQLADATMPGPENFIALGEPRSNGDHDFTRSIERLASGVVRLSSRIAGDPRERNHFRHCWILPEIIFAMS